MLPEQLVTYSCTVINLVVILWLTIHARRMLDTTSRAIVRFGTIVFVFLTPSWIMASLRLSGVEIAWWLQTLSACISHAGLVAAYLAVLQAQTRHLVPLRMMQRHPLVLGTLALSSIMVISDYSRRHYFVSLLDSTVTERSWTFITSELCFAGVLFYGGCFMLRLYRQILQGNTDPVFLSRTVLATCACALGTLCAGLLIISSLATLVIPSYNGVVVRRLAYDIGWPIVFILFIVGAFAFQRVYTKLEHYLASQWQHHQRNQRALLSYLHRSMVRVVPKVHIATPLLDSDNLLDQLIEVNDARRILWSHIANNGQLVARTEARELMELLQQHNTIKKAGEHKTPPLPSETMAYNLAVARELKRLERIQRHEPS